jgi:hypothetical protein
VGDVELCEPVMWGDMEDALTWLLMDIFILNLIRRTTSLSRRLSE